MAQHADAVRHIFRRLLQQIVGRDAVGANDFIGGDPDTHIVVMTIAAQRSHHHVFRQKPGPAAFGHGDVDQRHYNAAQIENSHQVRGREGQLGQHRPIQDLLHVEHGKAKAFASAAEHAVLRFRRTVFHRAERLEEVSGVRVGGQWRQMKIFTHRFVALSSLSCKPAHRAEEFLARERLCDVTVRALLLAPVAIADGVL